MATFTITTKLSLEERAVAERAVSVFVTNRIG